MDRGLSEVLVLIVSSLILFWAEIVQRRVKATPVVEHLDVVEEFSSRFVAGVIHAMQYPLALQRADEALHSLETAHCDSFAQTVGDKLLAESGDAPGRLRREPVLSIVEGLSRTVAMERGSGHA